jgi:hypothetical protein
MIIWVLPWTVTPEWSYLPMNEFIDTRNQFDGDPRAMFIDSRGRLLMLRCSYILTMLKVAFIAYRAVRRIRSAKAQYRAFNMLMMFPWQNLAEAAASLTF